VAASLGEIGSVELADPELAGAVDQLMNGLETPEVRRYPLAPLDVPGLDEIEATVRIRAKLRSTRGGDGTSCPTRECEARARDHLNDKAQQRRAAENIEPTSGARWNFVTRRRSEQRRDVQPVIEPDRDISKRVHPPSLPYAGFASVGISPPFIQRSPFSTLYVY